MKNNYLYKKDALFELYPLEEGYDFFSINITHKTDRGNFYGKWFDFVKTLPENKGFPTKGAIVVEIDEIKELG